MRHPARRTYLKQLAAVGLGGALAGCNTVSDSSSSTTTRIVFTDASTTSTLSTTAPDTDTEEASQTRTTSEQVFDGGDLTAFKRAVRTANERNARLHIDPGDYQFQIDSSDSGIPPRHADFTNISDLTIEGNGATITFAEPMSGGVRFTGGTDITVQNLTLDYDPVPYTQAVINSVSETDRTLRISIDDGFPLPDHEMFQVADRVYALPHSSDGSFVSGQRANGPTEKEFDEIRKIADRTFELRVADSYNLRGISPDRRLTIVARNNTTTLAFYKVSNPSLQNVTIRASSGGAFAAQVCSTPSFESCTIAPPPEGNRQISTVADGIRITNCLEGSRIENCRHERLGDDSVAIDHRMAKITAIDSERTITVQPLHPFVVKVDDTLEALTPSGTRKEDLPAIESYSERFSAIGERQKPETITFEAPIRDLLEPGDYLGNTTTNSKNYTVRNSEFRNHRANIIRASTGGGLIEDNVLDGASLRAIELHTGTQGYWPAKGGATDVTVRNNVIRRPGLALLAGGNPAAILVHHETPAEAATDSRPNRDIRIVGNDIETCAAAGVNVEDAANVTIQDNTLQDLNRLQYSDSGYGVLLSNVDGADVASNSASGRTASVSGFGLATKTSNINATDNKVTVGEETRPGKFKTLVPVSFDFSRTVEEGGRPLAFLCYELWLEDNTGSAIYHASLGSDETGMRFGDGVDGKEQANQETWRWFGPADNQSVLYFFASDVAEAATLRMRGYPIEAGISAVVQVDGDQTDEITWQTDATREFQVSLRN